MLCKFSNSFVLLNVDQMCKRTMLSFPPLSLIICKTEQKCARRVMSLPQWYWLHVNKESFCIFYFLSKMFWETHFSVLFSCNARLFETSWSQFCFRFKTDELKTRILNLHYILQQRERLLVQCILVVEGFQPLEQKEYQSLILFPLAMEHQFWKLFAFFDCTDSTVPWENLSSGEPLI